MNIRLIKDYLFLGYVIPSLLFRNMFRPKDVKLVKIKYGNIPNQYILFLIPPKPVKKTALVLYHGGAWRSGTPSLFKAMGYDYAKKGYVTVIPGFRLMPTHKYPAIREDIFKGFKIIDHHLKKWTLGIEDYVVLGKSAGSHMGALVACDEASRKKYNIESTKIKGMISISGPLDLSVCDYSKKAFFPRLFEYPEQLAEGNPYELLTDQIKTRFFCVHGENDPVIEKENAHRFIIKINKLVNNDSKLFIEKNLMHTDLIFKYFKNELQSAEIINKWLENLDK